MLREIIRELGPSHSSSKDKESDNSALEISQIQPEIWAVIITHKFNENNRVLYGPVRLNLALCLLHLNLHQHCGVNSGMEFSSSEVGPKEKTLDMRKLTSNEILVRENESDADIDTEPVSYRCTHKGDIIAEEVLNQLPSDVSNSALLVARDSQEHLGDLIVDVYRKNSDLFEGNLVQR